MNDLRSEFISAILDAGPSVALRLTERSFETEPATPTVSLNVLTRAVCLASPDVAVTELVNDLNSEFFSARADAEPREPEKS